VSELGTHQMTRQVTSTAPPELDLETVTVAELAALLDAGALTSEALVRACLARIEALDARGPSLNAIRALNPEASAEARAADAARTRGARLGPLHGIPVLLKDNIDVAEMPTTAGSVALATSFPAGDAALVERLRAAGAVILGKVNLTEFANYLTVDMPSGYSSLGGQVLNPYDVSRSPSGSSAGSAVATAAGYTPVTVGTETAGSILSPASANSVVGVKPTVGLISRRGIVPIAASQDTAGPMTRAVADAAHALTALCGRDPLDPATAANPWDGHDFAADLDTDALRGARIGVIASEQPAADSDKRALWDAALAVLAEQGATLVPVELDTNDEHPHESTVLSYEFKRDLNAYLAALPPGAPMRSLADVIAYNAAHEQVALKFGQVLALASQAKDLDEDSADTATYRRHRALDIATSKDRVDAAMAEHRVTALLFVNSHGAGIGAKAGYPSITVPAGYRANNRWPFNVTFLGQAWSEPTLLGYAYAYEQAAGARRPPSVVNPTLFRARSA
jgi:amidase